MIKSLSAASALFVLATGAPAFAAVTTYTDATAFAAALGAATVVVEGYETSPLLTTIANGGVYNGVTYSFNDGRTGQISNVYNRIDSQSLQAVADATGPDFYLPGNSINVTFGSSLRAIGGYFNANPSPVDQIFLTAAGTTVFGGGPADLYDIDTLFFLGVISDTPFTTATFGSIAGTTGVYNFDNLTSAAVPEPASWALMIAGFGLVGASLRRRRVAVA